MIARAMGVCVIMASVAGACECPPPAYAYEEPPAPAYEPPAYACTPPPEYAYEPPPEYAYEPPPAYAYEPPPEYSYEPPPAYAYEPPPEYSYEPPAAEADEPPPEYCYEPPPAEAPVELAAAPAPEAAGDRFIIVVIGNPRDGALDPSGERDKIIEKGYPPPKIVYNPSYTELQQLPNDANILIIGHLTDSTYPGAPPPPETLEKPDELYFWGPDGKPSRPSHLILDRLDPHPLVVIAACHSCKLEGLGHPNVVGLAEEGLHSDDVPAKLEEVIPPPGTSGPG